MSIKSAFRKITLTFDTYFPIFLIAKYSNSLIHKYCLINNSYNCVVLCIIGIFIAHYTGILCVHLFTFKANHENVCRAVLQILAARNLSGILEVTSKNSNVQHYQQECLHLAEMIRRYKPQFSEF